MLTMAVEVSGAEKSIATVFGDDRLREASSTMTSLPG